MLVTVAGRIAQLVSVVAHVPVPARVSVTAHVPVFESVRIFSSDTVTLTPDHSLPGTGELQALINGIGFWGLLAALAGLVIGAATWALGAHGNNYQHTVSGRRAVLVSGAAALIIGAAGPLLSFLFTAGGKF